MNREITTRWLVRYPAWIYVGRVSINDPLSVNRSTNESQFPFDFFEILEIISRPLREVQTQGNSFLKSMSNGVGSDIERF